MKIGIAVGKAGRLCLQLLRTSCPQPFGPDSPAIRAFAMQPPAEPASPGGLIFI